MRELGRHQQRNGQGTWPATPNVHIQKADRQNTETPIGGNAKKRDKTKPADPNNYVLKNL